MRAPLAPFRHRNDGEILRLAVPAFGSLVAEPLFLLADAAIIGHLGTAQLAGLGIASTLLTTTVSLCVFLSYGATGAVARRIGAGDMPGALRQGVHGLWLAALLGTALAVLGLSSAAPLVGLFGTDGSTSAYAVTYLQISMAGLPAMLGVLALTGVLRGLQDTRTPMAVAVAANLMNVALNYGLVYGLDLGIGGSALGTVLSQWASAIAFLVVVVAAARRLRVSLALSMPGVLGSFRASAPLVLRTASLRAVIVLAAFVAAQMGSSELAAHQVAFTIWAALALGLDAVAIAGQALVGRYLGASDLSGTKDATQRMVEWSIGMGAVLGVLVLALHTLLPRLFTADIEVQRSMASALVIVALLQPAAGWVFALDGVLIGAGDARYLAATQFLTVLAFLPMVAVVLLLGLGLTALWLAIGGWIAARLCVLVWRVRSDDWAVVGATR